MPLRKPLSLLSLRLAVSRKAAKAQRRSKVSRYAAKDTKQQRLIAD